MTSIEDIAKELRTLQQKVQTLESELRETKDIQAVQGLLNHYTAIHDLACFDLEKRREWENLFAEDGEATYPYGTHKGRKGMGDWAFQGVSYFEQCQLLSSNFDISFSADRETAYVRTNCIAQWILKLSDISNHFDEGGFYHWTLSRQQDNMWKIKKVHLTINWTTGEDPTGVSGQQAVEAAKESARL